MSPLIKMISVDGFYTDGDAISIGHAIQNLNFEETELGKDVLNFNMVSDDADELFSKIVGTNIIVNKDNSGVFRYPYPFIHFESFNNLNEWIFIVALERTMLNVYENLNGPKNALQEYKLNYRKMHDWDLIVSYDFKPGQGILFRPWLFHSFSGGLIQRFKLEEKNG
jgi:hypothetical protein